MSISVTQGKYFFHGDFVSGPPFLRLPVLQAAAVFSCPRGSFPFTAGGKWDRRKDLGKRIFRESCTIVAKPDEEQAEKAGKKAF